MNLPAGKIKFPSFRARVFWSLIPVILLLFLLLGVVDLQLHRRLAEEEFIDRAVTAVTNLAFSSRLAVFTEDRFLLEDALKSVTGSADFAYAFIYGPDWKVLAEKWGKLAPVVAPERELLANDKLRLNELTRGVFQNNMDREKGIVEFLAPVTSGEPILSEELQISPPNPSAENATKTRERIIGATRVGLSLNRVNAHIATLLWWRGGLIGAFLILSAMVVYVFSRRITRPINRLTDQAKRISKGHLDQEIPVDSQDEIGQLAASFNDMARALRAHYATMEQTITHRTTQLKSANQKLAEASRHKTQFLANVNHELRTPLSAIIGYARLLKRETDGQISRLQRNNIQDLLNNAERLLGLIDGLLDIAKIEAGRLDFRPEPIEIYSLIDDVVTTVTPLIRQDSVRLVNDIAPNIPTVNTDPVKLRQVILNLLSNAARFTEDGEIKISASRDNGAVKLTVSDTGIGIPEQDLPHIFEEFRQAGESNGREHGGTGLGLTIAKKFTDLLGGEIAVKSEVGKGSTFTVTLPTGPGKNTTN